MINSFIYLVIIDQSLAQFFILNNLKIKKKRKDEILYINFFCVSLRFENNNELDKNNIILILMHKVH